MYELGNAKVTVTIDDKEALKKVKQSAAAIQSILKDAFSKGDYFNEINRSLKAVTKEMQALQKSSDIKLQLDAKVAENELRRFEKRFDGLGKRKVKVDIDFEIKDDEVTRIRKFVSEAGKLGDTIKVKTAESNVSQARSTGNAKAVREAEKELAILKEMLRYKNELERVRKLGLDAGELSVIEDRLERIHRLSNRKIDLEFKAKGLDKVQEEARGALSTILDGALLSVGHSLTNMLSNAVRGAVSGSFDVVKDSLSKFAEFGASMNEFAVATKATPEQIKLISDEAKKLGKDTSKSTKEVAQAAVSLATLGFSADKTKASLGGVVRLSEATASSIEDAAKIVGVAQNSFGADAQRIADVVSIIRFNSAVEGANEFAGVFSKAGGIFNAQGQSLEQLAASYGALRSAGFDASSGATGLKVAITRLIAPTGAAKKALQEIGLEAFDANGKMKPFISIVGDMKTRLASMTQQERGIFLKTVFGDRGGPAMVALLQQSGGLLDDLLQKATNAKGATAEASKGLLKGLPGAIELMKGSIETLQINFGEVLGSAAEVIARTVMEITNVLIESDMFSGLTEGAQRFADYLTQNKDLVTTIAKAIQDLAEGAFTYLGEKAIEFTDYLKENPQAIQETVDSIAGLLDGLGKAISFIVDLSKGFAETWEGIDAMLAPIGELLDRLGLTDEKSGSIARKMGEILGHVSNVANKVTALGQLSTIAQIALDIADTISFIANVAGDVARWINQKIGLTDNLSKLWNLIKNIMVSILNPVGAILNYIKEASEHSEFFKGIWNGLESTFSSVGGWINQYVINPIMAAKNALGGLLGMGGNGGGGGSVSGSLSEEDAYKLLDGGSNSLVAKIIGMSEGNRTAQGGYTKYYYGHTDPGNSAYNLGSFSAQGDLNRGTPEASDQAVLQNMLRPLVRDFIKQSSNVGVKLTPKLLFNYLDSYVQSPLAAKEASSGPTFFNSVADVKGRENDDAAILALRRKMYEGGGQTRIADLTVEADQSRRMGELTKGLEAFVGEFKNFKSLSVSSNSATGGAFASALGVASGFAGGNIVGYTGDTGIGTGAHLDVRYADGSRRPSQEHMDRLLVNGTPLTKAAPITSEYGPRNAPVAGASTFHKGVDFGLPDGTPITLAVPAKSVKSYESGNGAGIITSIEFEDGVHLKLLHMNKRSLSVQPSSGAGGNSQANTKINALLNADKMDENDPEVTKKLEDDNKQREIDQALQAARNRYDLNRKEDRSMRENNIKVAREKQVTELKKQAVGVTDPTAKAQIDNRIKKLTEGGSLTDEITKLEMDLEDLKVARTRKQQDLKAGGDRAKRAEELPDFSKAIKNADKMIAQKKALRDATLGLNEAEYDYELSQKELQAARQSRDANREQDFAKQEDALKRQLAIAKGTNEEPRIQKQLDNLGIQKGMSTDLTKLQDQRQDKQLQINKFKKTLGKGEKSKELELMMKESQLLDQQIAEIKRKAQQEGIILDLKYRQEELEISRKRRDEERARLFEDSTANLRDEIALMEINGDNYARIKNIQLDRLEYDYKQSEELQKQQDVLDDLQSKYDELKKSGGVDLSKLESDISAVKRNIEQIQNKTDRGLLILDAKELKELEERAKLLNEIKQSQQSALQESTFNRTQAEIGKIRKTDPFSSRANNMERDLLFAQSQAKLQSDFAKLDAEAQEQIKQGANPAETLANIEQIKQNLQEIAQIDLTENLSKIPNILQQSADIVKQGLVSGISDVVFGAKTAQEALSDLLGNLAKQLLDMALNSLIGGFFSSLFGGGGKLAGGLLGGGKSPIGSILGGGKVGAAAKGGTVKNYASGTPGDALAAIKNISNSITKERMMSGGRNPQLAVVNAGELIIDAQTSDKLRGLTSNGIKNYAMGNVSLRVGDAAKSNLGGVMLGDVNVNINGNATEQDGTRIAKIVRAQIVDELLKQKKPGGLL